MRLYQITNKGQRLARSVNSPRTPAMMVLYYMDKHGSVSDEQIRAYSGVDESEIGSAIGNLRRKEFIQEV